MTRPGPVTEDPDLAVELDVRHALLARSSLLGRIRLRIAHLGDVAVAEERVVVDRELRIEGAHLAVGRDDQRVDLAQHRVAVDERRVQPTDDLGDLLLLARVLDAGAVNEPPRLPRLEPLVRIDVQPDERLGLRLSDLLDVDTALRREHQQRLLLAAVEGDREVVLARDVGRALDPELADDMAVDVEAEDVAGARFRFGRALGELDPAGLPAASRQHLGLDDDGLAELRGRGTRLLRARREPSLGDGDAVAAEELLALVLVQVHGRGRV